MRTLQRISDMRTFLRAARDDGKVVGLVPTMGALHDGHLALIRQAQSDCDTVVVSVFVNPTQFGAGEDFARYPRDLARDSRLAQQAGAAAIFAPSPEDMYPAGFQTTVAVRELAARWEGERRPGHFDGVATVCTKLFEIVRPSRAYFGQKDYQQAKVIERLVADLNVPLVVVSVPTVREPDGLAMSSRNAYLSPDERAAATVLFRALSQAQSAYAAGERSGAALQRQMADLIGAEPMANADYVAVADADTLEPVEAVERSAICLLAVRIGSTRLIDNVLLAGPTRRRVQPGPTEA